MIEVELLDHMGSDTTVAKAARVSFQADEYRTEEDNVRLINYLAKHGHWSPFAHCFLQFRIKAPLFVARQLAKHQVGLSWNEVSRRYVDHKPEFHTPEGWRGRAKTNKQGSSGYILDQGAASLILEDVHNKCLDEYEMLLKLGVSPEQARMVLPQTMLTEWYWSGSLYACARVYKERSSRLGGHSQREAQAVADLIERDAELLFPHSWFALTHPQLL